MTADEARKTIEEWKSQGYSEEDLAGAFYLMFMEEKIELDELENLLSLIGYQLTEEFKSMSPEEQRTEGFEVVGDTTPEESLEEKGELEKAEEGTTYEESEGKGETQDDEETQNDDEEPKNSEENDPEEEERKKAMRLMGLDK